MCGQMLATVQPLGIPIILPSGSRGSENCLSYGEVEVSMLSVMMTQVCLASLISWLLGMICL